MGSSSLPRAARADYQDSQTAWKWKTRKEKEDEKWASKRNGIYEEQEESVIFSVVNGFAKRVLGCETDFRNGQEPPFKNGFPNLF